MGGQFGTKEAGEFIDLGAATVKAYDGAMADGKLGVEDIQHLIPVGMAVPAAVEDAGVAVQELGELDAEDAAALHSRVESAMGGTVTQEIATEVLAIGVHTARALTLLKERREANAAAAGDGATS